jgi:hypothetical protein
MNVEIAEAELGRAARTAVLSQEQFKHEWANRVGLLNFTMKGVQHDIRTANVFLKERQSR